MEIRGDAGVAAFPLGGIGTGNVSLGARGDLRDWELGNAPAKGTRLPYTFFALHAAAPGRPGVTRILESRLRPPHEASNGYLPETMAGFPRFRDSVLHGEYPLAMVDFLDDGLPLRASLEAFTPLVPLDVEASGLPAAVLRYRVRNTGDRAVEATVLGTLFNPIPEPRNELRSEGALRGLSFSSSLPPDDLRSGTIVLATGAAELTANPDWPAPDHGALTRFWRDLREDGRLDPQTPPEAWAPTQTRGAAAPGANAQLRAYYAEMRAVLPSRRLGSLGIVETIEPGEEASFEFVLAWHFPNRPRGWCDSINESPQADEVVRNFYATRFGDAWAVAAHVHERLASLEEATRLFHDALHRSSLPQEIVSAAATSIATLRSTTVFRLEDGTFAGWEGSGDGGGSWSGTCTHVWNFAQTAAFLFPELEQSMRRVEFLLETEPDGLMQFRTNRIFGGPPWGFMPAVDGQLGAIVRVYREWRFTGDDAFLRDLWPNVVRSLEFALRHWDADGDAVLEAPQHNTYDIEFVGATSYANSLLYAALTAVAALADHLGEQDRAARYRALATRGAETMDRLLWNGEYYVQAVDDPDSEPYQFGDGCNADSLFGQLLAHVTGLGYVLPADRVRDVLQAIVRHNFKRDLSEYECALRTYALDDESGLINCTWPRGGRPEEPYFFADEIWTGMEYQVAAHLLYEGSVEQGLELVRAARGRHDGYRRSPWNEVEAGFHYARSMSAWALLLAYSGVQYDAAAQSIAFAPLADGPFRCFFSTGSGWGVYERDDDGARLRLLAGTLTLAHPTAVTLAAGDVLPLASGRSVG
jgi:uncharacterized protein (DUF608 family)